MSRVIDSFINDVCSYIKYKGVHKEVKQEGKSSVRNGRVFT